MAAPADPADRPAPAAERRPAPVTLHATMPSHPRYLQFVRALAGEGATVAGFSDEDRGRIELAVVEGFTNVIRHVYKNDHRRPVELRLTAPPGLFLIEIEDEGTFVDPSTIASRSLDDVRPGGLGVHLMKTTMYRVEYRRNAGGGTTLSLEKRTGAGTAESNGGAR
jgi:anti-sigma regulatory factor (Ser/Thr protein kinase)